MSKRNRRRFLAEVGGGMLAALVGPGLAIDMGLTSRVSAAEPSSKTPEGLERLVGLLQETPANKLVPALLAQLEKGATLRDLVAAAAVANARAFGGHNYDGYHTFMALAPSFKMAEMMPKKEAALPVIKVIHRNSRTMRSGPDKPADRLKDVKPGELKGDESPGKQMLEAARAKKLDVADGLFVAASKNSLESAYNELQEVVHDEVNVHRVVLAWRSWETIDFTGVEHARTLLRQSIHFCCDGNQNNNQSIGKMLSGLMDKHKLMDKKLGTKEADDAWVEKLSKVVYGETRENAAEAVAMELAAGYSPDAIGEALSLACARLVLADPGREKEQSPEKPVGSVHGDSIGVHASDSVNAWRHIARVSNARNTFASLIAGAYHTAGQIRRHYKDPYPHAEDLDKVTEKDPARLLKLAEEAIRARDQKRVCAVAQRYGEQKHEARALFDLLLRFAVSEDGNLHAEKYFYTVTDEFASLRKAYRWQHLVALARVTASEFGNPAPGVEEARKLLG